VIRSWDGTEYVCDEDGKAVIQGSDRQVLIYASYPGYETGRHVIPVTGDSFTMHLRLSGVMQGRELVIEAARPGTSESRTGRSVALNAREIAQSGEIGVIEDVMNAIKLLPGVNYGGFINTYPSIRGGHPGEMTAALDGFYINNPYHWGGAFSIFDPRMVESAQLSHGVFSSRYGHTISGLLEVTTKKPSSTETQFELGMSMIMTNFNLSLPINNKGGILFMGRVTYYDLMFAVAKNLLPESPEKEMLDAIKKAPYIRAGAITGNYRFTDNLELMATGFFGMDGVSAGYSNRNKTDELDSERNMDFDFYNYQGFLTTSLAWNPRSDMLLKLSLGTGYEDRIIDGELVNRIYSKRFSDEFLNGFYNDYYSYIPQYFKGESYDFNADGLVDMSEFAFNLQGRVDYDWEINDQLLLAAGVQEMYNLYRSTGDQDLYGELWYNGDYLSQANKERIKALFPGISSLPSDEQKKFYDNLRINVPISNSMNVENNLFTTSGYLLAEYNFWRFNTELGLRIDHFYLLGDGFTASSDPALNPRLNVDLNILKNTGILQSFDISAGTGLFSSVNSTVFYAEDKYGIHTIKPNRSWTSILGFKLEFPGSLIFTVEGYHKYVFDRMYIPASFDIDAINLDPRFDGVGKICGLDFMLHKIQGRFWDGWLTYSYNWAKYRDPGGNINTMGLSGGNMGDDWYFPNFHRYHNLNLILNIKPVQNFNIYIRFGMASGAPSSRRTWDEPKSYPVLVYNSDDPSNSYFIEKYVRHLASEDPIRTAFSFPMDIKFSLFGKRANGKTRYELYFAIENILSLVYDPQIENESFNQYTGRVDKGTESANYDIPIPIPSFGFKISY
jgi:hypothetical protein